MAEPRLRGWSSFPPCCDAEKLVLLSDAGELGLFGILQAQNLDPPLFPLLRTKDCRVPGVMDLLKTDRPRGRAQVVHTAGNDLWLLVGGQLQRWQLLFDSKIGPQLVPHPQWNPQLILGSPLHESQVDDAGTTVFLVTQSLSDQTCLASAVDLETGQIRWQRQLGLVCSGAPLLLGSEVVALDQGGGLFVFDPPKGPWNRKLSGKPRVKAWPPHGQPCRRFVGLAAGARWHIGLRDCLSQPGRKGDRPPPRIGTARRGGTHLHRDGAAGGDPAVGANNLLLPLADGRLLRLPLPLSEETWDGPNWKVSRIQGNQHGHAVCLGGDDFLTTNGHRGLTRWHFEGNLWHSSPEGRDAGLPPGNCLTPL